MRKAMLKILQARLQLSKWTENFQMFKLNLGRRTRDWLLNIHWLIQRARESQKNIFCFIDYDKAFDRVDYNKLWKILQEMGIPENLTCSLRNLYAGQEATVRTRLVTNWERSNQGCILSPCLFNLYAEYIIWNAGLGEVQAGIKTAGRNINYLKHAHTSDNSYTTLMAESEEELKSLLMKVK